MALICKSSLNVKDKTDQIKAQNLTTVEYADFVITSKSTMLLVYVIYKLPHTSVIKFCEELADMLAENIIHNQRNLILLDDFNIHLDVPTDPGTMLFNDFLASLSLPNHINVATHTSNHTLDLLITSTEDNTIVGTSRDHLLSDYHFVHTHIKLRKTKVLAKSVSYQKLKCIDHKQFNLDLHETVNHILQVKVTSLDDLIAQYDHELRQILDNHALKRPR